MFTYTQSSLGTFVDCPEKYRLAYVLGGHGIAPVGELLRFVTGKILHKAQEILYAGHPLKEALAMSDERYDAYAKRNLLSPKALQDLEVERCATRAGIIGYAHLYRREIAHDKSKIFIKGKPLLVDWIMKIRGRKYRMRGEIDTIGVKDKKVYLVETKSASSISSNLKEDVEMSPQTIFYLISYYQMFYKAGQKLRILFNYIRKPSIRQRNNESIKAYMQRVSDDYKERPTFYFHRAIIKRTSADILRFKQELINMIRAADRMVRKGGWYRNRRSCNAKGRCQFFDICAYGQKPGVMAGFRYKTKTHEELDTV